MPEEKKIAAWIGIGVGILAVIGIASAFKKKPENEVNAQIVNINIS